MVATAIWYLRTFVPVIVLARMRLKQVISSQQLKSLKIFLKNQVREVTTKGASCTRRLLLKRLTIQAVLQISACGPYVEPTNTSILRY